MFVPQTDYNSGPSLKGFAEWLASKDQNETYNWQISEKCACAQYGDSIGFKNWTHHFQDNAGIWDNLNKVARGPNGYAGDYDPSECTFGKLRQRVEKQLA
jgi:hypothetical protein